MLAACASQVDLSTGKGRLEFAGQVDALLDRHEHLSIPDPEVPPAAAAIAAKVIALRYRDDSAPPPRCRSISVDMRIHGAREEPTAWDWQCTTPRYQLRALSSRIEPDMLMAARDVCSIADKVAVELSLNNHDALHDPELIDPEALRDLAPSLKLLGANGGTLRIRSLADGNAKDHAYPLAAICLASGVDRLVLDEAPMPALLRGMAGASLQHLVVKGNWWQYKAAVQSPIRSLRSLDVQTYGDGLAALLRTGPVAWQALTVRNGMVSDDDTDGTIRLMKQLQSPTQAPRLTSLSFEGTAFLGSGHKLPGLLKNLNITQLSLHHTTGLAADDVLKLLHSPGGLQSLDLGKAELTWPADLTEREALTREIAVACHTRAGFQLHGLDRTIGRLDLSGRALDPASSAALTELLDDPRIKVLTFNNASGLQARDVFRLADTGRLTRLEVNSALEWPEDPDERNVLVRRAGKFDPHSPVRGWGLRHTRF